MVVDLVLKEQHSASILTGESRRLSTLSRDHTPTRSALVDDALDQLIRSLHCTIEVFLRTGTIFVLSYNSLPKLIGDFIVIVNFILGQ